VSIIKTIVEWHDGKVWFESEENVGTTFYSLPKTSHSSENTDFNVSKTGILSI
jgi:signal transduction histidine kinase